MSRIALEVAGEFSRTRIDEQLRKYIDRPDLWTYDELYRSTAIIGRLGAPTFIAELDEQVGLPTHVLRSLLGELWNRSWSPELALERDRWVTLFNRAGGYTLDGHDNTPPAGPVRLWRGSSLEYRDNMTWTDSRDLAASFAFEVNPLYEDGRQGALWTAVVDPDRIWAGTSLLYPPTSELVTEYVTDTWGLEIVEDNDGRGLNRG
ncbi:hypothetical protein [Citricoccus sp. GCM10030269]|uniref:hypothetical protein n=1 Tax=Citricoccus sp. GCM10030269 TaxID=3273388 RepID=UPI00360F43DC